MSNPFVHAELMTNDVAAAKSFFSKLFDWDLEDMQGPTGTYTLIKVGEGTGGGMMKNPIPNAPSSWLPYVLVDDLNKAVEKAKSLGGKVMKDKTEVAEMGSFVIINDPTGAMLGLWETKH